MAVLKFDKQKVFTITMSQEEFAASLSPIKIPDIHKADLKTEVNEQ